ncbi:HNH endonuclease [Robertmurraya siralis]|uniref:HNH endonuclease n=1 Tax=Robertmurraya siralis TaxID=77777 RepID=UPI0010F46548|nr:HNH endonuclease signature motif containing protein [Robertmurraya siralis]
MKFWNGNTRICSNCRKQLPENTYFFASGGKKLHHYCKLCERAPSYGWGRTYNKELNENGFHYCNKCDRILPLNILYFQRTNGRCNKTGFSSNCKECMEKESGFGVSKINTCDQIKRKEGYKICSNCHIEYPDDPVYYFNRKDRVNGTTICKKCKGFKTGIQRLNKVLKGFIPEGYRYCNPCGRLLLEDEFLSNGMCRECTLPRRQKYNQRPEVKERLRLARQKRRSIEKQVVYDLSIEDIEAIFAIFDNSCAYCGMNQEKHFEIFNQNLHCDHIHPLNEGGFFIFGNVIPSCKPCNTSKNTKDIFSFYDYNEKFAYERLEKILNYINKFILNIE